MNGSMTSRVGGGRLAISIVIPAYNEAARLPHFLRQLRPYLEREFPAGYEVVVVDDGSSDGLEGVISDLRLQISDGDREGGSAAAITVLRHEVNGGKGAALRTGVLASRGQLVLMCDADGAARIEDEKTLREAIAAGADVAVGSRYLGGELQRAPVRRVAGSLFSRAVRALFGLGVRDTQCGFKMLRGDVARSLLESTTETGYLVDLELLLLAEERCYRIVEVPVAWREMPGSKLSLWHTALPVAEGLWRLHRRRRSESRSSAGFFWSR